jgi:prolyl-tRNA synthetase
MMQDRKALQAGTSHFLGQNFAKASDIKFLDDQGELVYAWTTSWGVSTRLIGGLLMTHSDDDGLVLPPRLAPAHVVLLPVIHKEETKAEVLEYCHKLVAELRAQPYAGRHVEVELDDRDIRGGEKSWQWVKKGIPLRVEVGPRDIASDSVFVGRRDRSPKDRYNQSRSEFVATITQVLDEMQQALLDKARTFRQENTRVIDSKDEFYDFFTPANKDKPEIHGGFAMTHWSGDPAVERQINDDLSVTIRCIPLGGDDEPGTCPFSGAPSPRRVVFGKSY